MLLCISLFPKSFGGFLMYSRADISHACKQEHVLYSVDRQTHKPVWDTDYKNDLLFSVSSVCVFLLLATSWGGGGVSFVFQGQRSLNPVVALMLQGLSARFESFFESVVGHYKWLLPVIKPAAAAPSKKKPVKVQWPTTMPEKFSTDENIRLAVKFLDSPAAEHL